MTEGSTENAAIVIDDKLLRATVNLNTVLAAGVCGLMGSCTLLTVTCLALYRGHSGPDSLLNLLGAFLPGYDVSELGAWVGFLWGGLLGAVFGAVLYRVYARNIRERVAEYCRGTRDVQSLEYLVLRFSGHALGLAFGGIAAAGLFITTNWLAIAGQEKEISSAVLLAHFLPGYSVTLAGSLIGSTQMFVIGYLFCRMLGAIYNRVVTARHGNQAL